MSDAVIQLLQAYPWLPYVWLVATIAATVLRSMWPEQAERPRWVVGLLAALDLLQANLSGPVKLLTMRVGKPAATVGAGGGPKP